MSILVHTVVSALTASFPEYLMSQKCPKQARIGLVDINYKESSLNNQAWLQY